MSSITIIIAAYNAAATIERAIASALDEPEIAQIVVVDDASTDDTAAIAAGLSDDSNRLIILHQEKNAGPSAARNRALAIASCPWVGVLDADDFILPGRSAGLLAFAKNADLIADDMWQVDESGPNGKRRLLLGNQTPRTVDFDAFVISNVTQSRRQRAELGFIKPLMRRDFLTQHNLRYQEHMRLGEDFELYARALALGARMILLPVQGYVSVVRKASLSGQHSVDDLRCLRDSDLVLQKELTLTPRNKKALRRHYLNVDCRLQWRLLIEAVKQRNLKAALATFVRPYPVPFYLARQLLAQPYLRTIRKRFGDGEF